MLTLYIIV